MPSPVNPEDMNLVVDMALARYVVVIAGDGNVRIYGTADPEELPGPLRHIADDLDAGKGIVNDVQFDDVDGL